MIWFGEVVVVINIGVGDSKFSSTREKRNEEDIRYTKYSNNSSTITTYNNNKSNIITPIRSICTEDYRLEKVAWLLCRNEFTSNNMSTAATDYPPATTSSRATSKLTTINGTVDA
jgi:hypothetical protein